MLNTKDPANPESAYQIVWNEGHCYGVPFTIPLTGEVSERIISVLELFLTEVEILPQERADNPNKDSQEKRDR